MKKHTDGAIKCLIALLAMVGAVSASPAWAGNNNHSVNRQEGSDAAVSDFRPAPEMGAAALAEAVKSVNPYVFFRPGMMLEYQFQRGPVEESHRGVSRIRQKVADIRVQNGLLVPYVKQMVYGSSYGKAKGVPKEFYDYLFPVEIDAKGNYFLTHNPVEDLMTIEKRAGYGVFIPGDLHPGMQLPCSKMMIVGKTFSGKSVTVEADYQGWYVAREETMITSAGTFDCLKVRGRIYVKTNGGKPVVHKIACWMARGVGIVCYDTLIESNGETVPLTFCLTRLQK